MTLATGALILGLVVIGAVAQRVAGLGFAMLISPFMTLLIGAHSGVVLVNVLGVLSSALIVPRVWRSIDWSMFRWLSAFAVVGSLTGAWVAGLFSPPVMAVAVGGVVIVGLGASLLVRSGRLTTEPRAPRAVAGLLSGLTNSLAGVGGPAVSAYAVLTRWPQVSFAATLQPYFLLIGATSATAKLLLDPRALPATDWWFWGLVVLALLAGIGLGERLLRRVTAGQVRRVVILLAFAGAAASVVQGLVELLA
ncbi:sulfite exporter TauE/SafE family protein [Leucobacter tenebrionis]|uniref:sulfite exporter TauE/SafE family protein n=1 Tax=Leucobacter tenebrionis TaxID=2873270 RepID=UPI001CA74CF9|nr:sulfite exporter TauE/SafE family protein [Leucobacter tenebrionis]QZY51996.1 sulfite exporter TauE/SafE family protein [Leucobacter tenebrionis]